MLEAVNSCLRSLGIPARQSELGGALATQWPSTPAQQRCLAAGAWRNVLNWRHRHMACKHHLGDHVVAAAHVMSHVVVQECGCCQCTNGTAGAISPLKRPESATIWCCQSMLQRNCVTSYVLHWFKDSYTCWLQASELIIAAFAAHPSCGTQCGIPYNRMCRMCLQRQPAGPINTVAGIVEAPHRAPCGPGKRGRTLSCLQQWAPA